MRAANPVLRRELIERWRGRRAVATMTAYLAVLGGILYLLYKIAVATLVGSMGVGGGDLGGAGPVLGRFLVEGLLFFVLLLVLFVSPGYAAAQLSGERERRTLPLLQITLLSPFRIVLGKLGASVAWLSLLVATALPLGAAAFFLGGVTPADLLRGIGFILVVAVGIAGVALGVSSVSRRTTASIVVTYAVVLALVAGSLFAALAQVLITVRDGRVVSPPVALYVNPFYGLADAAHATGASASALGGLPSPLGIIAEALPEANVFRAAIPEEGLGRDIDVASDGMVRVDPAQRTNRTPVWLYVGGLYLGLGAAGVAVATRKLRTGRTPARIPSGTDAAEAVPGAPEPGSAVGGQPQ